MKDEYYNDFTHKETSDGNGYVAGTYTVQLPDGRTQIVEYKADDYTGFVADVKFEGEAKYDSYKPAYKPDNKPSYYKPGNKAFLLFATISGWINFRDLLSWFVDYKPDYTYKPEYKPAYPEYKPTYPEYKPTYPEYKPQYPEYAPKYPKYTAKY